jgi:hypothetical protein
VIENTFLHMPGVGPRTERRLWDAGVLRWRDAGKRAADCLSGRRAALVARCAAESIERLAAGDVRYFSDHLRSSHQWRLYREFRDSVAYVDIETTGLGGFGDHITTVALYDGRSVRHYVRGENLEAFAGDVAACSLLVTYNGKTFDVPWLRRELGAPMDQAHVDLRYVLHSLGYKGGLKGCERQLGLDRGDLEGVDGYFAVLLWREFRRNGDPRALETLLAYNVQDVLNLETLMVLAYNMKLRETGCPAGRELETAATAANPFAPHRPTIERIRREHGSRREHGWL